MTVSADNFYNGQQTTYIRPQPRPDFSLPEFPTPQVSPTPTYDPSQNYLASALVGSIDHLRVGDIWISMSADMNTINFVGFTIQPIECVVDNQGVLTTYAVQKNTPVIFGPLAVQDGRFYANQNDAVLEGVIIPPDEAMGTVYLHYKTPAQGSRVTWVLLSLTPS